MNEFKMTRITSGMPIDDDYVLINGVKYKRVEEPKEPKTLYEMFYDDGQLPVAHCRVLCELVNKWISQFHPDDMSFENLTYCNAFFDALDKLRNNLHEKM
jgi:hypothetical protein